MLACGANFPIFYLMKILNMLQTAVDIMYVITIITVTAFLETTYYYAHTALQPQILGQ